MKPLALQTVLSHLSEAHGELRLLFARLQFAVLVAYLEDPGPAVCRTHSTRFYRFDRADVTDDAAFLFSEVRRFWRCVEEGREPPQILPA